jgi:hypothetical protein
MVERSAQHVEAMARATGRYGRWKKLCSGIVVIGLTILSLWIFGANSPKFPSWATYLIGATVALLVGYVLLPGATYLWSRLTYNGRTALAEIRALRDEVSALPASTAVEESRVPVVPRIVIDIRDELKIGLRILKRCPKNRGSQNQVPAALTREANAWIKKVSGLLVQWPEHQAQFDGPIGFDTDTFTSYAAITQEMTIRTGILLEIVNELIKTEEISRP